MIIFVPAFSQKWGFHFTILTLRPAKILSRKNHTGGSVPAQTERG
jgi:hypothetical protein